MHAYSLATVIPCDQRTIRTATRPVRPTRADTHLVEQHRRRHLLINVRHHLSDLRLLDLPRGCAGARTRAGVSEGAWSQRVDTSVVHRCWRIALKPRLMRRLRSTARTHRTSSDAAISMRVRQAARPQPRDWGSANGGQTRVRSGITPSTPSAMRVVPSRRENERPDRHTGPSTPRPIGMRSCHLGAPGSREHG